MTSPFFRLDDNELAWLKYTLENLPEQQRGPSSHAILQKIVKEQRTRRGTPGLSLKTATEVYVQDGGVIRVVAPDPKLPAKPLPSSTSADEVLALLGLTAGADQ